MIFKTIRDDEADVQYDASHQLGRHTFYNVTTLQVIFFLNFFSLTRQKKTRKKLNRFGTAATVDKVIIR